MHSTGGRRVEPVCPLSRGAALPVLCFEKRSDFYLWKDFGGVDTKICSLLLNVSLVTSIWISYRAILQIWKMQFERSISQVSIDQNYKLDTSAARKCEQK